jgi:hypothetical protein
MCVCMSTKLSTILSTILPVVDNSVGIYVDSVDNSVDNVCIVRFWCIRTMYILRAQIQAELSVRHDSRGTGKSRAWMLDPSLDAEREKEDTAPKILLNQRPSQEVKDFVAKREKLFEAWTSTNMLDARKTWGGGAAKAADKITMVSCMSLSPTLSLSLSLSLPLHSLLSPSNAHGAASDQAKQACAPEELGWNLVTFDTRMETHCSNTRRKRKRNVNFLYVLKFFTFT